jgi:hypothetical protein
VPADGKLPPDESTKRCCDAGSASAATWEEAAGVLLSWQLSALKGELNMKRVSLQTLTRCAVLVAMEVVLNRFVSIKTPF